MGVAGIFPDGVFIASCTPLFIDKNWSFSLRVQCWFARGDIGTSTLSSTARRAGTQVAYCCFKRKSVQNRVRGCLQGQALTFLPLVHRSPGGDITSYGNPPLNTPTVPILPFTFPKQPKPPPGISSPADILPTEAKGDANRCPAFEWLPAAQPPPLIPHSTRKILPATKCRIRGRCCYHPHQAPTFSVGTSSSRLCKL